MFCLFIRIAHCKYFLPTFWILYQDCLKISNVEDVGLGGSDFACVKSSWGHCGYYHCGYCGYCGYCNCGYCDCGDCACVKGSWGDCGYCHCGDCACVKSSWVDCGYCDCGLWLKLDIVDIVYIVTVVIVLV